MATLLLGAERKAKKSKIGKATPSFVASSPLIPPPTCPTLSIVGMPYLWVQKDSDSDEALSKLFSESGFNIVAGILDGGCYIDSHSSFVCYAVGARIDLLERRCGAGHYLLDLLENCPIRLWDPVEMYAHAQESFKLDFSKCTSDWIWDRKLSNKTKRDLPKNLQKLCDDVEKVEDEAIQLLSIGEYPDDESFQLPAVVLSWWDNIHWYNKQCIRNPTFTMEHGTNPAYAIMDSYAEQSWQIGSTHMGSPVYHDIDVVKRIVEVAKPYAKLIKYLNHDEQESGFNCF